MTRMHSLVMVALAAGFLTIVAGAQSSLNAKYSRNAGTPTDGRLRPSKYPGVEQAYMPAIAPSSHAANLIALRNGDLLCFWFTGTWEGQSGVGIAMSRLTPGSHQWSKPVLLDSKAGMSYQNPVAFQAPDGTLWLLHTRQAAGKGETGAQVLVLKSKDNGRTWSQPKLLFTQAGSFTRDPIVLMPDGGWLLPMYVSAGKSSRSDYSIIKITHNEGHTWTTCRIPHSIGLIQPSVVRLPDNHYVAFLRSTAATWIYRTTSTDGCHWTPPVKTSLPNNNSSIQAVMLRNHNIVMAFNNSPRVRIDGKMRPGPRKPVTLAVSTDGGKSWRWMRNVETGRPGASIHLEKEKQPGREAYSYPTVIQDPDGKIDVAFTYRRETIKFMRLPESWIEQSPVAQHGSHHSGGAAGQPSQEQIICNQSTDKRNIIGGSVFSLPSSGCRSSGG